MHPPAPVSTRPVDAVWMSAFEKAQYVWLNCGPTARTGVRPVDEPQDPLDGFARLLLHPKLQAAPPGAGLPLRPRALEGRLEAAEDPAQPVA